MNAPTGIEGGLTVGILVIDATVADVRLRSARPTGIGTMLAGRPMGEALSLVPMLFSLCGIAQGIAAANACEAAIGITASPAQQTARDLLILGEMADSHAWQIAMEWPRLIGAAPDPGLLSPLRKATSALAPALYPSRDWTRPGGGILSPNADKLSDAGLNISTAIGRLIGNSFSTLRNADDLHRWSRDSTTLAARLISRILAEDMAGFGRSGVATLPDPPADWFALRLTSTSDFSNRPHLDGKPAETGALHRMAASPLIADLKQRHGNGLLSHFAAKLMELASLPVRLSALSGCLSPEHPQHNFIPSNRIRRWRRRHCARPACPLGRSRKGHRQVLQDRGPQRMELPSPGRSGPWPRRPARLRRSSAPGEHADRGARPLRALPRHDRGARWCMRCRCARASSI